MNRDRGQCTFVDYDGQQCKETRGLQVDHIKMVCRGGSNEIENLRILCSGHNRFVSERSIGKSWKPTG
jgi:5-methylcytosine-specific restriction endonuclease McrA